MLIVVSVFVCRRVNQDKVQSQTKDLQVSQGDMDHNSAYSSSFDGNNLPGGAFYNTQRNYNNSFFASDTMIIDSEPIYDDIVY